MDVERIAAVSPDRRFPRPSPRPYPTSMSYRMNLSIKSARNRPTAAGTRSVASSRRSATAVDLRKASSWTKRHRDGRETWVAPGAAGVILESLHKRDHLREVVEFYMTALAHELDETAVPVGVHAALFVDAGEVVGVMTFMDVFHTGSQDILGAYVVPWRRRAGVMTTLLRHARLHFGELKVHMPSKTMKRFMAKHGLEEAQP